ncbi:hypothetical protein [Hanstruepera marina]|uniref:hypothetical protein n=1 Tax=Hanstruepera marina TaxID=2873265 RepID=UPI001CA770D0|nr:hypothetical protein [Hanstruepera marina]
MNKVDRHLFNTLKQEVETTFLRSNSISSSIEHWKGDEIEAFQEDLFNRVKGKVSEKWFYTYIKNTPEKLPRIDVLNLLSIYVGFDSWNAFKAKHQSNVKRKSKNKFFKYWILIPIPICFFVYHLNSKNNFEFCFVDTVKNEKITTPHLDIKILQENESPIHLKTDSMGCFSFKTKHDIIKFIIQSPYHKTDTIIRNIKSNYNQVVEVKTDDYALMLNYYANGNIKDWKNHVNELKALFSKDVKIYRLFKNSMDIELYSKDEFIRMLTIPTKSLKRIEILDKKIEEGKIVSLKFIVK